MGFNKQTNSSSINSIKSKPSASSSSLLFLIGLIGLVGLLGFPKIKGNFIFSQKYSQFWIQDYLKVPQMCSHKGFLPVLNNCVRSPYLAAAAFPSGHSPYLAAAARAL